MIALSIIFAVLGLLFRIASFGASMQADFQFYVIAALLCFLTDAVIFVCIVISRKGKTTEQKPLPSPSHISAKCPRCQGVAVIPDEKNPGHFCKCPLCAGSGRVVATADALQKGLRPSMILPP